MTTRREMLITLAAAAAAAAALAPLSAQAQTPAPRIIGVLTPIDQPGVKILIEGLRALGYEDGKNIRLLIRSAQGDYARLPALARELVDAKADVLIAFNTPGSRAAINATKTIPIIMTSIGDPVGSGLVASLARPGGNVTGLSNMVGELGPKRLALLHELVPGAKRIAVLYNPADPVNDPQIRDMTQAAPKLGVEVRFYPVKTPANLDETFTTLLAWRARAVIWLGGQALPYQAGSIKLAAQHKLPMMSASRVDVEAGGLMSYSAESVAMFRRTAAYADKILKGTPVGQLPVEQPTIFDLVLNMKTAKALGLKVPETILIQATTVIE
jgi:putative tryptophan/tyrosine transport system substrate-binding protein